MVVIIGFNAQVPKLFGMALMEHRAYDPNDGRVVTRDLADYLVPVNADMPDFTVQSLISLIHTKVLSVQEASVRLALQV